MIVFHHKTKSHQPKFPNLNMKAKISILSMFICVDDVTNVETSSKNHPKLSKFITPWQKTPWNFVETSLFSIKLTIWKETVSALVGMMSLASNSKLCNFITSLKLIKTPQKFVQGSFSVKLIKICHKNRGEVLASGPF